jgi:two-component system, OmpR family, KDP operon response regulator KdpE
MSNKHKILIVDDEVQIRKLLRISFESNNFEVCEAATAKDGISESVNYKPDIIILDLGLPDESGLYVLKSLREFTHIPVIILSVKNSEQDIIQALDAGADDYITKPFNTGELLARIRVAIRHHGSENNEPVLINGSISVDLTSRVVKLKNTEIKTTTTEYSLLVLFLRNPGKVLTHQYLLKEIWNRYYSEETQYLRVYIAQLRKKFEEDPSNPKIFVTEQGIGYRMLVQNK